MNTLEPLKGWAGWCFRALLSEQTKKKLERLIISIAILSFLLHLGLTLLSDLARSDLGVLVWPGEWQGILKESALLSNPIAAIYTPFSFILLYEVYLLVYYLPKSISSYIRKQYEIITLIVIRRIFKDMANLNFTENWLENNYDLQLTYDLITTLVLFFLIWLFIYLNKRTRASQLPAPEPRMLNSLVRRKKIMALLLVPILFSLAVYSFGEWLYVELSSSDGILTGIKDINQVFFDEFFTVLIMADVLLLLFSLYYTDRFDRVIRNSGFIISTVLLRLSFGAEGLVNNVLICSAVAFGVFILWIYNLYGIEPQNTTA